MKKVLGIFLLSSIFYTQASSSPESLGGFSPEAMSEDSVSKDKRGGQFPFTFERGIDSEGGNVVHIKSPTIGRENLNFFPGALQAEEITAEGGRKLVIHARISARTGIGYIKREITFNPEGQKIDDQSKMCLPEQPV